MKYDLSEINTEILDQIHDKVHYLDIIPRLQELREQKHQERLRKYSCRKRNFKTYHEIEFTAEYTSTSERNLEFKSLMRRYLDNLRAEEKDHLECMSGYLDGYVNTVLEEYAVAYLHYKFNAVDLSTFNGAVFRSASISKSPLTESEIVVEDYIEYCLGLGKYKVKYTVMIANYKLKFVAYF